MGVASTEATMFLFVRSAVCIGIVVAVLPHPEGLPRLGDVADAGSRATRELVGLCAASAPCRSAGAHVLQSSLAMPLRGVGARSSLETRLVPRAAHPAERRPAPAAGADRG
jgi:hypothetical protein